ncbi:Annexin-like protein RJ4 [Bienertia sinuspersici]
MRNFLVGIVSTYKYHGDEIDQTIAYSDANTLHDEIQDKGSIHEEIIRIISTRSKQQLLATFNHFKDIHGTSISKALRGSSENEFFQTIRVAIKCTIYPQKYFAKMLRNAIIGLGTDEDVLTRVIVTRAEIDLKEIKDLYSERNNVSLDQAIAGDTSGDYRAFLLTLLGTEGY